MKKTKISDLSMYDKPFNIDEFIFATPLTVRTIKLSRNGFRDIICRLRTDGIWQGKNGVGIQGTRWTDYPEGFVENFIDNLPEGDTLVELQ
jgi:hypothetical protein